MDRYDRQKKLLKELDEKIHQTKVAVVGLGGLGSFLSEMLARMGVKELILIDKSKVDLPDLHRQLYLERDLGKYKVEATLERLKRVNSEVKYKRYYEFNSKNAMEIFEQVDILFDATDNLETRYIINEASVRLNKPWIFGTAIGFKGYTSLIHPKYYCFECLFPNKISNENPTEVGVFSGTVMLAASLQLKLFLDYLKGKIEPYLYYFNLNEIKIEKIKAKRNQNCRVCIKRNFQYINGS